MERTLHGIKLGRFVFEHITVGFAIGIEYIPYNLYFSIGRYAMIIDLNNRRSLVDLSDLLGGMQQRPRDPKTEARIRAYQEAEFRTYLEYREQVLRFAGIFCTCHPYWDPQGEHGDASNCYIHGRIMYNPFTGEWLF